MPIKTRISFTVRATQREETRYKDGVVAQAKGTTIYMDWTEEGGGFVQWSKTMPQSTPFETAEEALEEAKASDGMPWWNKPDMESLKAIRLTNTASFQHEDVS